MTPRRKSTVLPCLIACLMLLTACEESDATSLRLRVAPDLSGTLTTSGLFLPAEAHPMTTGSAGVEWGDQVSLRCVSGEFANLASVRLDGIQLTASVLDETNVLRIALTRGPEADWVQRLVPPEFDDEEDRKRLVKVLDPSGQVGNLGRNLKFEVELPGAILAHGVNLEARRLSEDAEKNIATLVVPVSLARSPGPDIVWNLMWES